MSTHTMDSDQPAGARPQASVSLLLSASLLGRRRARHHVAGRALRGRLRRQRHERQPGRQQLVLAGGRRSGRRGAARHHLGGALGVRFATRRPGPAQSRRGPAPRPRPALGPARGDAAATPGLRSVTAQLSRFDTRRVPDRDHRAADGGADAWLTRAGTRRMIFRYVRSERHLVIHTAVALERRRRLVPLLVLVVQRDARKRRPGPCRMRTGGWWQRRMPKAGTRRLAQRRDGRLRGSCAPRGPRRRIRAGEVAQHPASRDGLIFRADPDGYRIEIIEQPTVAQTQG